MFTNLISQYKQKVLLPAIEKRMNLAGRAWVEEARRLVPVDTGQLRDSLGFTFSASTQQLNLYADKHYAIFIEMGTRKSAPHPFMRPAWSAIAGIWKGSVNLQFPGTAPQYHDRVKTYKYRTRKGANIQLGHGPFA